MAVVSLCALLLTALRAQSQSGAYSEYEVKAAFLFNFAKFVEWPQQALPEPDTPIVIGVLGEDPFGPVLDETVKGKTAQDRQIQIKRSTKPEDLQGCHIVYISASEKSRLEDVLARFKGSSALTVGDMAGFSERGGMINLTKNADKIGLEVNLAAVKEAALKISSQLLKLARVVKDEGNNKG